MRERIEPGEMCALALRFLATGESFRSLHFQFRLGKETISRAISEVCVAVHEEMGPIYVKMPNSRREWEQKKGLGAGFVMKVRCTYLHSSIFSIFFNICLFFIMTCACPLEL